jgi:hypothetical protein
MYIGTELSTLVAIERYDLRVEVLIILVFSISAQPESSFKARGFRSLSPALKTTIYQGRGHMA